MFTVICRGITYKTHDHMSKFKVTLRVQRSKLCNLYLVRPTTSRVIVVSSWFLVEIFTLICRRVTYKTYDSMSKVTLKGQRSKFCSLYFVQAITSQIIDVSSWYSPWYVGVSSTGPMTLCQKLRSKEVNGHNFVIYILSGPLLHKFLLYLHKTW